MARGGRAQQGLGAALKIIEHEDGSRTDHTGARAHYYVAQDGDRYYLALPDRFVVKLKPREVTDYLQRGLPALDELSHFLSMNDRKLEARNLPGIDIGPALHRYRAENGLPVMVTRDGVHTWEVVSPDTPPPPEPT